MKRIKLGLKLLILFAAIMIPLKSVVMVKADSGWDSSFGGGSSFGGSSFGGSSWGSSSSSWGSSGYSGGGGSTCEGKECEIISRIGMIFGTLFISIHYFFFFQQPLADALAKGDKEKSKKYVKRLVILRLVVMIVLEIIFPWIFLIDFFGLFIGAFIVTPIIAVKSSKYKNYSYSTNTDSYYDVSDEVINANLPGETISSLKQKLYDVFTDVQMAWMNFEYDRLKALCGEELATSYIKELDVLKLKNGQNVMHDFDLKKITVNSIKNVNGVIEIDVMLYVSFYDYVIDINTKKVTRGTKHSKVTNRYSLLYTKGVNEKVTCPKCGASVETNKNGICPYCRTKLNLVSSEYKLAKKSRIR